MSIPVVMVGTGDWARDALAPALRSIPETEIVACASPDREQALRFAADFAVPRAYPGLDEALAGEPRVGLLVVSTPDDHHVTALTRAIDAGIPVFCEKPVANSAADARELARRVAAAPVPGPSASPSATARPCSGCATTCARGGWVSRGWRS